MQNVRIQSLNFPLYFRIKSKINYNFHNTSHTICCSERNSCFFAKKYRQYIIRILENIQLKSKQQMEKKMITIHMINKLYFTKCD